MITFLICGKILKSLEREKGKSERGREGERENVGQGSCYKIVCFNWIFLIEVMAAMLMKM